MKWNISQCAMMGRAHVAMGIPCQDKVGILAQNDTYVAALADGAGSASHSHFGADCVVNTVCKLLALSFDEFYEMSDGSQVRLKLIQGILEELDKTAAEFHVERKQLASTLLFVAIKGDRVILGHVGDGVICYLRDGVLKVASAPTNGEFANSTVFVTSHDAMASMRLIKCPLSDISGFCMMSDGTAASLYDSRRGSAMPVVKTLLETQSAIPACAMEPMLQESFSQSVTAATKDDCSIVLMAARQQDAFTDERLCQVLSIPEQPKQRERQLHRYRTILTVAQKPVTLQQIALYIHLKPRHTRKYLRKLVAVRLLRRLPYHYVVPYDDEII